MKMTFLSVSSIYNGLVVTKIDKCLGYDVHCLRISQIQMRLTLAMRKDGRELFIPSAADNICQKDAM